MKTRFEEVVKRWNRVLPFLISQFLLLPPVENGFVMSEPGADFDGLHMARGRLVLVPDIKSGLVELTAIN